MTAAVYFTLFWDVGSGSENSNYFSQILSFKMKSNILEPLELRAKNTVTACIVGLNQIILKKDNKTELDMGAG